MTLHALDQLRARYWPDALMVDVSAIRALIIAGRAVKTKKEEGGCWLFLVSYRGETVRAIFQPEQGTLVTVLPRIVRKKRRGHRKVPREEIYDRKRISHDPG